MMLSLRRRQKDALKQMINLNTPVTPSFVQEPQWKVLVYDAEAQDIISPLLNVKELRELGVTLHLLLHGHREILDDVPAVYFVVPSENNIQLICKDFTAGLYECYYLNFVNAIPRPQLEVVAQNAVQSGSVEHVRKIFDQYLNFISIEDDFFCLKKHYLDSPLSYYNLNRGAVNDTEMSNVLSEIADGLFSVCVTLGSIPMIRCPRGNAAEHVSELLDKKLRDNLRDARNNLFTAESVRSGQISFQRPVLIILDRSMDMTTPLHHTWTYQALIHDVLDYDLNRLTLNETDGPNHKKKEYDFHTSDKFWSNQKGNPFPAVAEAVQEELDAYRSSEDKIKQLKQQMGLSGESDESVSVLGDTTSQLTSTVSSLPELLEQKKCIDMHTNIATAVLRNIKDRKLDAFFEAEERLMSRQNPERSVLEMIKDEECGLPVDRLRLLLIHFMLNDLSDSELAEYTTAAEESGLNLSALNHVKQCKSFSKMFTKEQYAGGGTKTLNMFSKLVSQSSQFVMEGVKNLAIKKHNLPTTKVVDAIMEVKSLPEIEDYRYFDPKFMRANTESAIPRSRTPFSEAIVFVVGGGNYVEYQNLVDYKKSKSGISSKRITYGCTDVINAATFVDQLSRLGGGNGV